MRVVQRGDGAGLSLEPLLQVWVTRHMLGQDLDSDGAVQARVAGFVDLAHAPGAEGGVNLIGTECRAGLKWHRYCPVGTRAVSSSNQSTKIRLLNGSPSLVCTGFRTM